MVLGSVLVGYLFLVTRIFANSEKQHHKPPLLTTASGASSFWCNDIPHNHRGDENKVIYVGGFGLGHRLSKLAAAYHLVQQGHWPVTHLEVLWGTCDNHTQEDNNKDIFTYLFGRNQIQVDRQIYIKQQNQTTSDHHQSKSLVIRNDVSGYYAGQSYKNAQIPMNRLPLSLWQDKLRMDEVLFQNLLAAFEIQHGEKHVRAFETQHNWSKHFVVGLHIRTGNGEQNHFAKAQRGIANDTIFLQNMAHTIQTMLSSATTSTMNPDKKPPLVFVATDTAAVVDQLQALLAQSTTIPVVSVPQPRVAPNQGVSYSTWTAGSQHCWQGWLYSMVDTALLSKVNVLIAGQRSTFTQILPRAMVLQRNDNHKNTGTSSVSPRNYYCEANDSGSAMACFDSTHTWLFRESGGGVHKHPTQSLTFRGGGDRASSVPPHKVMVHFPDPVLKQLLRSDNRVHVHGNKAAIDDDSDDDVYWWNQAQKFFFPDLSLSSDETKRLLFGFKISKKYRRYKEFQVEWAVAKDT